MANVFRRLSSLILRERFAREVLRGLTSETMVLEYGDDVIITASAFQFHQPKKEKYKGKSEMSINWMVNEGVLEQTMNQMKGGVIQFVGGVVKFPRSALDELKRHANFKISLSYNRKEIPGNKYHGNVLLRDDEKRINKELVSMVSAKLSFVGEYIARTDN